MSKYSDSIGKIKTYFSELDKEVLHFSPLFLKKLKCPKFCGACCTKFSLDYLKDSERWRNFVREYPDKVIHFKERVSDNATYMSYTQEEHDGFYCNFLNKENGLCTVHNSNPFHCEFEIIKLRGLNELGIPKEKVVQVSKQLFTEGASFRQVDGTIGAKCEIEEFTVDSFKRDIEMLRELQAHYKAHYKKENTNLKTLITHLVYSYDPSSQFDVFITKGKIISKEDVFEKLKLI